MRQSQRVCLSSALALLARPQATIWSTSHTNDPACRPFGYSHYGGFYGPWKELEACDSRPALSCGRSTLPPSSQTMFVVASPCPPRAVSTELGQWPAVAVWRQWQWQLQCATFKTIRSGVWGSLTPRSGMGPAFPHLHASSFD